VLRFASDRPAPPSPSRAGTAGNFLLLPLIRLHLLPVPLPSPSPSPSPFAARYHNVTTRDSLALLLKVKIPVGAGAILRREASHPPDPPVPFLPSLPSFSRSIPPPPSPYYLFLTLSNALSLLLYSLRFLPSCPNSLGSCSSLFPPPLYRGAVNSCERLLARYSVFITSRW